MNLFALLFLVILFGLIVTRTGHFLMLGAFLNLFLWIESVHEKLDLILVTLEEIQAKSIIQEQSIMATFKQYSDAQQASAKAILDFIKSETGEILAQLEAGKAQAGKAGSEAAFDEAIASLGSFTSSIGDAVSAMVPGLATPEVPSAPATVETPAVAPVEVVVPVSNVELPVVISETPIGVEGGMAIDVK